MHVLLRCDATTSGGVGHLVRCIALAEEVQARGGRVTVSGRFTVPLAEDLLESLGADVVGPASDAAELGALARGVGADVVHVDHYGLGPDLWGPVRASGAVLSSIEDGGFGRRPADVVVDPTLGAEATGRPDDGAGTVLLGIRFAPLRAQVRRAREARAARTGGPARALVVLGGTDPFGVTAAVVRMCLAAGMDPDLLHVLAPPARHAEISQVPGGEGVHVTAPDERFLDLAATSDVVLSAAGTTVWELACLGVAAGVVAVTDNQRVGYERAVGAGVAVGLGTGTDVLAGTPGARDALERLLGDPSLRTALGATGRGLVDGLGAARVVDAWAQGARPGGGPRLSARAAGAADSALLLRWRNDPATRAASRSTAPVPAADHDRWLTAVLADPARVLLVVEQQDEAVGTVRFDRVDGDLWEVSVTLAPEARGCRLAGPVLAAGEALWRQRTGSDARLLAHVRPDNAASLRLFRAAGYAPAPEHDEADVVGLVKPAR